MLGATYCLMSSIESDFPSPEQEAESPSGDDWGDTAQDEAGGAPDWGDVVQPSADEEWGGLAIPARRDPAEQGGVTVIESDAYRVDSAGGNPQQDAREDDASRQGAVVVREISGRRVRRPKTTKPTIEKISQAKGPKQRAKKKRWDVEDKEWSSVTRFRMKGVAITILGVMALIIASLYVVPRLNPAGRELVDDGRFSSRVPSLFNVRDRVIEDLLDRQKEAEALYEAFVSAADVDEVLPLVRHRAELEPLIRSAGHQARVPKSWKVDVKAVWSLHMAKGRPYARLQGEMPDFKQFNAFFVLENGKLLIDWKATTCYSSAPFGDLGRGEGDGSEVRGTLSPSNLYTESFNERQYQCYQFVSPDDEQMLWCYVPRNGVLERDLTRLFLSGGVVDELLSSAPATLKLVRGGKESLPNQWLIGELLHGQWIDP